MLASIRISNQTINLRQRFRFGAKAHLHCSAARHANRAIVYPSFGNPSEVLTAVTYPDLSSPPPKSLNVRYILSPINPADLNVVENKYHSKPAPVKTLAEGTAHAFSEPHFVGGNEGLAEVIEVGKGVEGYKVGDRVVLTKQQSGTWASARTLHQDDVLKVPEDFSDVNAATITVGALAMYDINDGVRL